MFKRLSAILLALLVFVASTGYSISAHLCGGKAVSYSLFGSPAGCGMEDEADTNAHCGHPASPNAHGFQAQKCCSNLTVIIQGLQNAGEVVKKTFSTPVYVTTVNEIIHFSRYSAFVSSVKPPFSSYHPPARARDLSVLLQIFRI